MAQLKPPQEKMPRKNKPKKIKIGKRRYRSESLFRKRESNADIVLSLVDIRSVKPEFSAKQKNTTSQLGVIQGEDTQGCVRWCQSR